MSSNRARIDKYRSDKYPSSSYDDELDPRSKKSIKRHNNQDEKKFMKTVYNKKDLQICPSNTLIIIDWDDTLYPTSWGVENGIDLTDPNTRYKYMNHFEQLDDELSATLELMITLGDVVIITNAMPEWIELATSILPKTKRCLSVIDVVSARMRHQNHSKMSDWKKYTFAEELVKRSTTQDNRSNSRSDSRTDNHKYINILSLGDAEYEHNALVNLYTHKIVPHKYLKSVKFIRSTNYDVVIEQIKMIKKYITDICRMTRQVDMTFDTL